MNHVSKEIADSIGYAQLRDYCNSLRTAINPSMANYTQELEAYDIGQPSSAELIEEIKELEKRVSYFDLEIINEMINEKFPNHKN